MAELGYEEGKNFSFEYVQAANVAGYEAAYRELASRKVDILLAGGSEIGLKSALATAGTRPVVMVAIDYDPLARGYVRSLARPGANLTGISFQQIELTEKRLQIVERGIPGCAGDRRVLGRNIRRPMACGGERGSEARVAACRRQVPRAALRLRARFGSTAARASPCSDGADVAGLRRSRPRAASRLRPYGIGWRPSFPCASMSTLGVSCPMGRASPRCIGVLPNMSTASRAAPGPPTCRSSSRPSSN